MFDGSTSVSLDVTMQRGKGASEGVLGQIRGFILVTGEGGMGI